MVVGETRLGCKTYGIVLLIGHLGVEAITSDAVVDYWVKTYGKVGSIVPRFTNVEYTVQLL